MKNFVSFYECFMKHEMKWPHVPIVETEIFVSEMPRFINSSRARKL